MSLNWTMVDSARKPVPLPDEMILKSVDSGAEVSLSIPDAPPASSSTSGGSGGTKTMKESGGLWLTDQRLIFVASSTSSSFQTLSIPLLNFISVSFEQPLLGSNYIKFDIRPTVEGGLTMGTKGELRLKDRGIFEFCGALQKTRERAIYAKRAADSEEETLPMYEAPPPSSSAMGGPSSRPMEGEAPPGYDA